MSNPRSAPRVPLSPASPPDWGVKQQSQFSPAPATPHTPPSPESMSVATKRYVPAYEDGGHTNEMANRSPNSYLSQSQRPPLNSSTSHAQQPLSQPTNMLKRPAPHDDEERPTSKRQRKEDLPEISFTATNHDRQDHNVDASNSQMRLVVSGDTAMQDAPGNANADLLQIFKDVGSSFRIGRTTHKRASVDMNQHLLGAYGLHPLLSQVARFDPSTGEKINRLRKSYEGQIKNAHLPGRTKAHVEPRDTDNNEPSKLRTLGMMPEQEFLSQQKQRKVGDLSGLQDVMGKALRINPGTMPPSTAKNWDDVLGHEMRAPPQSFTSASSHSQSQQPRVPNGVRPVVVAPAAAPDKMRTRGKKRSYDDNSFIGYRGYGDGLSEPEEEHDRDHDYADRGGKKRRKD